MAVVKKTKPKNPILEWVFDKPVRIIVVSFVTVILLGTILLILPISAQSGNWTSPFVALFTACSATCVTGLVLVDTATYFSFFGQVVILSLIQIGGLGLATITSFFFSFLGRKKNWKTMQLAQESTANLSMTNVMSLVRMIVIFTFSLEAIGALILVSSFLPVYGQAGIWKGIFQSVSAFCNAGFDLHGDSASGTFSSLVAWNHSPIVVGITAFLFVAGGLGFIVWQDLLFFRRHKKLKFYTKLVVIFTLVLIVLATLIFYAMERNNTSSSYAMGSLPEAQKPLAALFQAVTPRTAGFNTIDQGSMHDSSKLLTIFLMFVGAAPAGTGGGIKITTFVVFVALIWSNIRDQDSVVVKRHEVNKRIVARATAIFGMALALVFLASILIAVFERKQLQSEDHQIIDIVYETVSAFGTVGLTSLGTAKLSTASHVVLLFCMFVGRVGPAAFAISIAGSSKQNEEVYPEAKLLVG